MGVSVNVGRDADSFSSGEGDLFPSGEEDLFSFGDELD